MKTENLTPRTILTLDAQPARLIRHVDERLMSYNIEFSNIIYLGFMTFGSV